MVGQCTSHLHRHCHFQPHHSIYQSASDLETTSDVNNSEDSIAEAYSSQSSTDMEEERGSFPGQPIHSHQNNSTSQLIEDSIERRTQRTYRYGIGLVCVGATLNWLGFAQGTSYQVDPLRYLGVACVLTGSFCVCVSMCRWLGKPISVTGHSRNLEDNGSTGDVHVINVAVPIYMPSIQEEYRPTKPPDYEQIVGTTGEPPPYDEAIKLSPGAFFGATDCLSSFPVDLYTPPLTSLQSPHQETPSHQSHRENISNQENPGGSETPLTFTSPSLVSNQISRQHDYQMPFSSSLLGRRNNLENMDAPPPAYEHNPRISSCSSYTSLLLPTAVPSSVNTRWLFSNSANTGGTSNSTNSLNYYPVQTSQSDIPCHSGLNNHLPDTTSESVVLPTHRQNQ